MRRTEFAVPAEALLAVDGRAWRIIDLPAAVRAYGGEYDSMPYVIRVLAENLLRWNRWSDARSVAQQEVQAIVDWRNHIGAQLPLHVARIILPDSSGIPVLQDLAALRDAVARSGGDPANVDACLPVDLIVDHSLQVDRWGTAHALAENLRREFERNAERYAFLKWAGQAFRGLRVLPPGSGIIHQINLEQIAPVVATARREGEDWAFPDFVLGGDSHTPMINSIGVLGWGVGGLDAEAALLGHAYTLPVPEVVGVRLSGRSNPLAWTTDLALLATQKLRQHNVTSCAVEFFGPVAAALTVAQRATLANMAPEYGATCGFFAVDGHTLDYLRMTGRTPIQVALVEAYCRRNGLFREPCAEEAALAYTRIIEIDVGAAEPCLAGPRRPQDRLPLGAVAEDFRRRLSMAPAEGGFGCATEKASRPSLPEAAVVIAAITSCTNTSNPEVMMAAGLVARKAVERGLAPPPWVKTSLAPGSRAVTRYLDAAGLLQPLASLGFHLIGYGCTTCGGKSGPLDASVASEIEKHQLTVAAVLSGNRNFEGRIHKLVRANYIGAPPLVVAYALAGRIDIDLTSEPLGRDRAGQPVYLRDLLPAAEELNAVLHFAHDAALFGSADPGLDPSAAAWNDIPAATGPRYPWDPKSQYLVEPPFFARAAGGDALTELARGLRQTRVLAAFGDSLTTDHISPGGEIPPDTPAGRYLLAAGVEARDFNTYVARRGNHEVMARATFANVRLRNALVPGREGGWTRHFPEARETTIYEAAQAYRREGVAVIVLAGKEYGTGSSRDWAAKGSALLGVHAVIAESYERIHRANLIGMGILPLAFSPGQGWRALGLGGTESYDFDGVQEGVLRGTPIRVTATRADATIGFDVHSQVLTTAERELMAAGGIPRSVLKDYLHK